MFLKTFFCFFYFVFGDRLKKIFGDLFFGEHLCLCPWSWPREGLSLTLASEFFCVLGHEPCVFDPTSVTDLVLNKFRKTVKKRIV